MTIYECFALSTHYNNIYIVMSNLIFPVERLNKLSIYSLHNSLNSFVVPNMNCNMIIDRVHEVFMCKAISRGIISLFQE